MNSKPREIEDIDDDLFISKKPQNYIFADKKAEQIKERSNAGIKNCLRLVNESEQTGISTIEELATQRETLEKVENDLDNINTMTRSTQKHLNSMKSLFGGIKSYFSQSNGNSAAPPPITQSSLPKSATLDTIPNATTTSSNMPNISSRAIAHQLQRKTDETNTFMNQTKKAAPDSDLGDLNQGLGRLKELALKLGNEIEDQNDILDRITDKSERAADTIQHQNRQMKQLLRK